MFFLGNTTPSTSVIEQQITDSFAPFRHFWETINWEDIVALIITKTVQIALTTLLFLILQRIGRTIIHRGYKTYGKRNFVNENRAETLQRLIDNVFRYTMFFIYVYTILWIIGVPIGSLITGAGIAGIAIGLGAQGFMNDLITGLFIIIEQQLDVGDHIRLLNLNIDGIVVEVGIRSTRIKAFDGAIHYVPNRNITTITNLSREDIRVVIDTRVLLEEGIDEITKVIENKTVELSQDLSAFIQKQPEVFGVIDLGNSNYAIRVTMYVVNGEQGRVNEAFTTGYVKALTENNFTIPHDPIALP